MADNGNFERSMKDNLANAWKGNPGFRILTIAVFVVFALAIGISVANVRKVKEDSISSIRSPKESVKDDPFSEDKSETWKRALEKDEEQRVDDAIATGQSVLPYAGTFDNTAIDNNLQEESTEGFLSLSDLDKLGFGDKKKKANKPIEIEEDSSAIWDVFQTEKKDPCGRKSIGSSPDDSYNANGLNAKGYDKDGYMRDCLTEKDFGPDGYASDGYDRLGYDRDGYDKNGFNKYGMNKNGFNSEGYDKFGYDSEGYDSEGYDKNGFNRNGISREGKTKDGTYRDGLTADDFGPDGYAADGYNKEGYDRDGFNKEGYDRYGYNKEGYDKNGFNRNGVNHSGVNKTDLVYNEEGYDQFGYDKNGYNKNGYDKNGYDAEGYGKNGFNKEGFNRNGINREGKTKAGTYRDGLTAEDFDPITGLAKDGYDQFGYDENGYNKEGYDKNGYDENGYNKDGYDKDGFKRPDRLVKEKSDAQIAAAIQDDNRYTPEQKVEIMTAKKESMSAQIAALVGVADPVYNQIVITGFGDGAIGAESMQGSSYGEDSGYNYMEPESLLDEDALLEEIEDKDLIISAGSISYAVALTESNSDVPGPVLAKILTGPLKGFKVLGGFSTQDDYLVIQFTKAILGHEEYDISAFALDPGTTLPGMASKIDRHYLNRFVLPVAAAFIEGLGSAIAETESTQTVSDGTVTETEEPSSTSENIWEAVSNAGGVLGGLVEEQVESGPTIRVFAGSEMGILFIESVYGENDINKDK